MKRRLARLALGGIITATLVAGSLYALSLRNSRPLAARHANRSSSAQEPAADPGAPYDWSRAFGGAGQRFSSMATAQRQATFAMRSPQGFTASDIEVAPSGFAVGWAFSLPQYGGWVHLVESKATTSAQAYADQFKSANVSSPTFIQTTVDHGTIPAVLASANGLGRLMWSDGSITFDISGEGTTPIQVAALVEQMLYAAG